MRMIVCGGCLFETGWGVFPYPASGSATEPIHVDVKPGRDKGTLTGELNSFCFKYKGGAYK